MKPLIWRAHRTREDFNECPHCGKPLRWIYIQGGWVPCDKEPTLFMLHPSGDKKIVYKKQIYEICLKYKQGDPRFDRAVFEGNEPHYYTCPVLIEERRKYAKGRGLFCQTES